MRRIFLSFYLFVLTVLTLLYFLVGPIGNWYLETYLRDEIDVHMTDLTRGIFYMIESDLALYPESGWPERIQALQPRFGYPISVTALAKASETPVERQRLRSGEFVFRNDSEYILARAGQSDQVIVMGPLPNFDDTISIKTFEAVVRIIVLLFVGLLSLVWGLPFWRNLNAVSAAAGKFGKGEFGARAEVMRFSSLKPLANAFNAMAERIQRLIGSHKMLLNAVSHEFRTPISRIRFGIEMAESPDPAERKLYLEEIARDVDDLDGLVSELLTYTRFDRERPELLFEELPAAQWLSAAVERTRGAHGNIRFHIHEEDLPATVPGDARYLTRALENLLSNAARHARTLVDVRLTMEKGKCLVRVEDDGPGIPEAERKRIFDPFVRLDESRNRNSGGRGLGLAVVRQIMEWHGGSAEVDAAPSGGARFTLAFPGKSK